MSLKIDFISFCFLCASFILPECRCDFGSPLPWVAAGSWPFPPALIKKWLGASHCSRAQVLENTAKYFFQLKKKM